MMLSKIRRHVRTPGLALVAIVGVATAAGAQERQLTPEEQAKLEKLKGFMAKSEEFLPTINRIDPNALPVTFPFELVLDHIVVDVAVGDGEALPYMFDTGAPTYITQALSDAKPGETIVETVGAAGGGALIWKPLRRLPSLTVGGSLTITDATGQVGWDPDSSLYCVSPHGLFGAPSMRNAVWQVDYGKQEITVAASVDQLDHIEEAIALPFTTKPNTLSPTPMVELGMGDGTLAFVVDTGGGIPLTVNTESLAKVGIELPADAPAAANLAGGAAGSFEFKLAGLQLPVRVGNTEVTSTVFVGNGMAPTSDGNMGHMFLKNFVVTFDWSTKMMHLDPIAEDGSIELLSDAPAAGIGLQDGKIVVSSLAVGGPADKAGLSLGDIVVEIDGKDVQDVGPDDLCKLQETKPQSIRTASGATYDIGMIEGFFGSAN